MTETFLLCGLGAALGGALGAMALRLIVKFRPNILSELDLARIDWRALVAVMGLSLVAALAFGALAALAGAARAGAGTLRAGAVGTFSRGGERLRSTLVVTEMALSAMLLVGASLLVRSVVSLQHTDFGFEPANLEVISAELSKERFPTPAARLSAMRGLATALTAVPGVSDVTLTDALPSWRHFSVGTLEIDGQPRPDTRSTAFIDVGSVSESYFRTVRAKLVAGRLPADSLESTQEIVVNEGWATRQWKPGEALGKRVRVAYQGEDAPWYTIVGVVRDISTMGPVGDKAAPFLYLPLGTVTDPGIIYRTNGSAAVAAQGLALAKSTLPNVRVRQFQAAEVIASTIAPSRFIMMLMTGFTILAVVLAAVGLYGMMAYAVAQRTREIGIRIALGASQRRIARSVVGRAAALGLVGAAIGLVLAGWSTRVIEGSLYGVGRLDAISFVFGGGILVATAVLASVIPMRRAVAIDPVTAIRSD